MSRMRHGYCTTLPYPARRTFPTFPLCPIEAKILSLFRSHCTSTIYSPGREPSATLAVPSMVKEWSGNDAILCHQSRFRDMYSWFLRFRVGSSREEGLCIRQVDCGRVDATQLEMGFATGSETHPTLLVYLRGGNLTGKARSVTGYLEPFPEVSFRDARRIPGHPSYHRFLEMTGLSLHAIQPMKQARWDK